MVLIIGILSAVALPQYETAVDKARFVKLIALAKPVKDAQERYYLANGVYTEKISDLDIDLPPAKENGSSYKVYEDGSSISLTSVNYLYIKNQKMLNNTLVLGYDHGVNEQYAGWTCQAALGNERAQRLCRTLGGINPVNNSGCVIGSCTEYKLP